MIIYRKHASGLTASISMVHLHLIGTYTRATLDIEIYPFYELCLKFSVASKPQDALLILPAWHPWFLTRHRKDTGVSHYYYFFLFCYQCIKVLGEGLRQAVGKPAVHLWLYFYIRDLPRKVAMVTNFSCGDPTYWGIMRITTVRRGSNTFLSLLEKTSVYYLFSVLPLQLSELMMPAHRDSFQQQ